MTISHLDGISHFPWHQVRSVVHDDVKVRMEDLDSFLLFHRKAVMLDSTWGKHLEFVLSYENNNNNNNNNNKYNNYNGNYP